MVSRLSIVWTQPSAPEQNCGGVEAKNKHKKPIMPQQHNPSSGQDWDPVNVGRSGNGGIKAVPKSAQELSLAKAKGLVTTEKRHGAGGNQSAHSGGVLSARKLDEADDVGTIVKVDKSLSKAIMQVRRLVCRRRRHMFLFRQRLTVHTSDCSRRGLRKR